MKETIRILSVPGCRETLTTAVSRFLERHQDFSDGDSEQVLRLSFAGFLRELEKEQQVCYGGFRILKQC